MKDQVHEGGGTFGQSSLCVISSLPGASVPLMTCWIQDLVCAASVVPGNHLR